MFVGKLSDFLSFIRVVLLKMHFGSGAGRVRIGNDFIRIRILSKVSDPTGSGSTTLPKSLIVPVMEVSCALCASLRFNELPGVFERKKNHVGAVL
jgi:hypothetical protein